jgi:hypothetical protein
MIAQKSMDPVSVKRVSIGELYGPVVLMMHHPN